MLFQKNESNQFLALVLLLRVTCHEECSKNFFDVPKHGNHQEFILYKDSSSQDFKLLPHKR
jgi:hypothetical protein